MTKRASIAVVACLLAPGIGAYAGGGQVESQTISVDVGATTAGTNTITISGYLDSIYLDVPAGTVTGAYNLAWLPPESTAASVLIYTNSGLTADLLLRPRLDGSTIGTGAALTSDPPDRLAVPPNGKIRMIITDSSATNLTWKAIVIYEKDSE